LYFFLLLSLFCCEFTNTIIVLFLMTYSWHFYMANKDVFKWSATSNSRHAWHVCLCQKRISPHQHAVKHVWLIHQILKGHWIIKLSNLCLKHMYETNESKFERNEALSDLSNSDALFHCDVIHCINRFVFTEWDSGCIFSWKS
jgi:hypothetical protein